MPSAIVASCSSARSSITAARRFESDEVFDPDGISLPLLTGLNSATGEQWSQELRLNYDAGGRLRGFVGAGLFHEEGRAGHGVGKPLLKQADEGADVLAFLAWQLGDGTT